MTTGGGHPESSGRGEPLVGPSSPSGVSSAGAVYGRPFTGRGHEPPPAGVDTAAPAAEVLLEIRRGLCAAQEGDDLAAVYMRISPLVQAAFAELESLRSALRKAEDELAEMTADHNSAVIIRGGVLVKARRDALLEAADEIERRAMRAILAPDGDHR